MIELYRETGEPRYLEAAKGFFAMRDLVAKTDNGGDDNQDRVPFLKQNEAVGHAVRANYLFAGSADLFAETGDPATWQMLERVWKNVVEEKLYITGACGALYDGASPDGLKDQKRHGDQPLHHFGAWLSTHPGAGRCGYRLGEGTV